MKNEATKVQRPPIVLPASASPIPDKTPAQRLVQHALVSGALVGGLQVLLAAAAVWMLLDLLDGGTLVSRKGMLITLGALGVYIVGLRSLLGLRKHARFRPSIAAACQVLGLLLAGALALSAKGKLGAQGLKQFLVQEGAKLPAGEALGQPEPLVWIAAPLAMAGALAILPLFYMLRLYGKAESRRLLRWKGS